MKQPPPNRLSGLDALQQDIDERRSAYREQIAQLEMLERSKDIATIDHARLQRLFGVTLNRAQLHQDALQCLRKAERLAVAEQDFKELSAIHRERAVVYAWRGDDRQASIEIAHALAYAAMTGNNMGTAQALAELGRVEWEARRYETAVRILRLVISTPSLDLPKHEAHRVKMTLCQALNRLGRYEEAVETAKELADAPDAGQRLHFLARLEEANAHIGLAQTEAATAVLAELRPELPANESAFEHTEFLEVEAALLASEDASAVEESLAKIAAKHDNQRLTVRSSEIRMELGRRLFEQGQADRARQAYATALQHAVAHDNKDLAERVRSEMLKNSGDSLEEIASDVEAIAGSSSLPRRFIFLKRLGQGGFGVVHKALDLRHGVDVALKRIFLASVHDPSKRARLIASLKAEYGAAHRLPEHPSVARVRDILMEPDGTLLVIQDYVSGHSLRDLYRPTPQTASLLPILAEIADVLTLLHGRGVVHRDLKPENVIVQNDTPVLIDFGIALVDGSKDVLNRVGTIGYAAPEQLRGDKVDGGADIYALGKMIAEALGEEPSTGFSLSSVFGGGLRRGAQGDLRSLLRDALAEDPRKRLTDSSAMATALREAVADFE